MRHLAIRPSAAHARLPQRSQPGTRPQGPGPRPRTARTPAGRGSGGRYAGDLSAETSWIDHRVIVKICSLTGYCLGMAVYALVVVAMYPAFKTSTSLDKLIASDSTAAALLGVTGRISSSGGWLNGNIYANFFPLIML